MIYDSYFVKKWKWYNIKFNLSHSPWRFFVFFAKENWRKWRHRHKKDGPWKKKNNNSPRTPPYHQ